MKVFDLKKFVVDNGEYIKEGFTVYSEYNIGDSGYSIRVSSRLSYCDSITLVFRDKYIQHINTTSELDKVEELEELLESCQDIAEVMDYYAVKYIRKRRIESEEQKKLDSFMLKGE